MNRINTTLLLMAASAGASFVLMNTQTVTPVSAKVSQSLIAKKAAVKTQALKADAVGDDNGGQIGDVNWNITGTVLTISGGTIDRPTPESSSLYPWIWNEGTIAEVHITGPLNLKGFAAQNFLSNLPNLEKVEGLANLNFSGTTSVSAFFGNTNITNLDLSQLHIGGVSNLKGLFANTDFTSLNLTGLDTHSATNMAQMFYQNENLSSINFGNMDTSSVTDMSSMFAANPKLKGLDFSADPNFNTSQVQFMNDMFAVDPALTTLNVSNFKTGNVLDMHNMFAQDSAVTSLDLTNWETGNVTDMSQMFAQDPALTTLDLSNFDTGNVETMEMMFGEDTGLTSLNVSSFKTDKVKNMSGMFLGNTSLPALNVRSFNTSNVTDASIMFGYDTTLKALDLSSFDLTKAGKIDGMLGELQSLQRITLGGKTFLDSKLGEVESDAALDKPAGGDEWQAVASGTIANPAGAKFTPAALMALYANDQTPPAKETYVLPGQTDQSAIELVPSTTIPLGGTFDPAKVFISAITPEGVRLTNLNDAIGAGLTITGADFNTNTLGQYKVTFQFAGSNKPAITIVTINPNGGGGGGGGNVTPPAPNPTPTPTPQPTPPVKPETPTVPGNVAKKKHAVYALKAIYLYKNPTFKKSQRIAAYPKQKRTNRPMFVVINYGRSSNGTLRYKVRDVNHGRKSDGKIGYITANWKFVRGVYYQSVPKNKTITVISKKGVHAYKNKNLTGRVKSYKKGTRLTVKKIVTHNLTTRYVLSNGTFVTANKKLVIQGKY